MRRKTGEEGTAVAVLIRCGIIKCPVFVPEGRNGVRSDQSLEKEIRETPG